MAKLIRIVAAVVDTKRAILYKEDGTTIEMLQGDTRLRPVLEHITPLLTKQGYADIDLTQENSWQDFEEKTNGAVRLFRIAKSKLAEILGTKKGNVTPMVAGVLPSQDHLGAVAKNEAAVAEIMQHAVSVKSENFSEDKVAQQRPTVEQGGNTPNDSSSDGNCAHFDKAEETIVAVTPKGNIVPGVERIKSQFTGAAESGNTKGMTNFLERMGAMVSKRGHSVQDLLRFMERGDLPVADDGCIIIYKRLYRQDDKYVDPHSRQVFQRVGSFVHMDESLVNPNRGQECSSGLHVARRGYIRHFNGDVIVLAKVRPEDVIAVPNYDANKMRVCAYHIIAELTPPQFHAIANNRPISEAEGGEELLGKAISGDHIGIIENVKITGELGRGLVITPVETVEEVAPLVTAEDIAKKEQNGDGLTVAKTKKVSTKKKVKAKKKAIIKKVAAKKPVKAKPLEATVHNSDKPVDIKALVAKKSDESVSLTTEAKPTVTQTDVVKAMWDAALNGNLEKARELLAFKKKAKKGWAVWGLPVTAGDTLKALLEK